MELSALTGARNRIRGKLRLDGKSLDYLEIDPERRYSWDIEGHESSRSRGCGRLQSHQCGLNSEVLSRALFHRWRNKNLVTQQKRDTGRALDHAPESFETTVRQLRRRVAPIDVSGGLVCLSAAVAPDEPKPKQSTEPAARIFS